MKMQAVFFLCNPVIAADRTLFVAEIGSWRSFWRRYAAEQKQRGVSALNLVLKYKILVLF